MSIRNHYLPRTSAGRKACLAFLLVVLLSQPPIVFWVDRTFQTTWIFGVPFLYSYLATVYFAQIGVLIWALWKKV